MTAGPSFATVLDSAPPALTLPVTIRNGGNPSLTIADGFVRGSGIVGRFAASPGLIGLKVAAGGRPVRVTLSLHADAETAQWWEHRVPARVTPRTPHGPRLLLVRSQGRTRTAVLLSRRPGAFGLDASATVGFDLTAEEVPDDGLLIVEVADATGLADDLAGDRIPHAAVGVRLDSLTVAPCAGQSEPAPRVGPVAGSILLVVPTGPTPGSIRATLRARPTDVVVPDPIAPPPGPLWEPPPTGAAPLRYRDKGIAVARQKLGRARFAAALRARRGAIRGGQGLSAPLRYAMQPMRSAWRTDDVRAELVPLDGGPAEAVTVTRRGTGAVEISHHGHLSGPAVIRLSGTRRVSWRLLSAAYRPPAEVTPAITDDAVANQTAIQTLLDGTDPVTVVLPPGRIPLAGGLTLRDGRAVRGADSTLVQVGAGSAPVLHVLGSGVCVEDLAIELPSADPGPHDGDRWTAITIGRYFYPRRADWISDIAVRRVRVERAGRCTANSVAILGAVRDTLLADLDIAGGGTGVAVHWGAVGRSVSELTGPSYHPHRLHLTDLLVRDAFEGFYLSSVHDVSVTGMRCRDVEIGFRLLPGDNTDRFHQNAGGSPVSSRISVSGCDIGWRGPYAIRLAGWGRSEIDGAVTILSYRQVTVADCVLRAGDPLPDAPERTRTAVVREHADGIVLRDIEEIPCATGDAGS